MRARLLTTVIVLGLCALDMRAQEWIPVHTTWLDLVARYRAGQRKEAVVTLASWPAEGMAERVLADLEMLVRSVGGDTSLGMLKRPQQREVATIWSSVIPIAAVLHLEAARDAFEHESEAVGRQHLHVARRLVDWERWPFIENIMESDEVTRAHDRLRRDVYIVIAWILQARLDLKELDAHLDRARDVLPDEAEIWLASGSAMEFRASPRGGDPVPAPSGRMLPANWYRLAQRQFLAKAESYYRRAIACDASLAEAHMRLGRVLQLDEKRPEARQALERARELATTGEVAYLASLFLASIAEEEGNDAEALTRYEDIVKRWPGCQSAHIGLSHLFERKRDRQLALGALRPLWTEGDARTCPVDPWWLYDFGQTWRLDKRLEAMGAEKRP